MATLDQDDLDAISALLISYGAAKPGDKMDIVNAPNSTAILAFTAKFGGLIAALNLVTFEDMSVTSVSFTGTLNGDSSITFMAAEYDQNTGYIGGDVNIGTFTSSGWTTEGTPSGLMRVLVSEGSGSITGGLLTLNVQCTRLDRQIKIYANIPTTDGTGDDRIFFLGLRGELYYESAGGAGALWKMYSQGSLETNSQDDLDAIQSIVDNGMSFGSLRIHGISVRDWDPNSIQFVLSGSFPPAGQTITLYAGELSNGTGVTSLGYFDENGTWNQDAGWTDQITEDYVLKIALGDGSGLSYAGGIIQVTQYGVPLHPIIIPARPTNFVGSTYWPLKDGTTRYRNGGVLHGWGTEYASRIPALSAAQVSVLPQWGNLDSVFQFIQTPHSAQWIDIYDLNDITNFVWTGNQGTTFNLKWWHPESGSAELGTWFAGVFTRSQNWNTSGYRTVLMIDFNNEPIGEGTLSFDGVFSNQGNPITRPLVINAHLPAGSHGGDFYVTRDSKIIAYQGGSLEPTIPNVDTVLCDRELITNTNPHQLVYREAGVEIARFNLTRDVNGNYIARTKV